MYLKEDWKECYVILSRVLWCIFANGELRRRIYFLNTVLIFGIEASNGKRVAFNISKLLLVFSACISCPFWSRLAALWVATGSPMRNHDRKLDRIGFDGI